MRESMLVSSILNNAESWTNITKRDLENLEKPDTLLHRNILDTSGNPSKAFMYLELGVIPAKFVMMEKQFNFLKYILKQSKASMIRQVYETLKLESIKGDFIDLIQRDMIDLKLDMTEEDILNVPKMQGKSLLALTQKILHYTT